jgi:hypothetical protein
MSITPRGMSIQEAYRRFREDNLLVNRKYQRKLVWSVKEKQKLIESILKQYPIPLILFAETSNAQTPGAFEIIDGMQRLDAIFSFIENAFAIHDEYFDVAEFATAKQAADANLFSIAPTGVNLLDRKLCAALLDYQLAVTIYPAPSESDVTEVFGRINSNGKHLSDQERRQAGVITPFAEMVRKVATELRGDASKDILLLSEMPEISIESSRSPQRYGLKAEEIFWCKQGIMRVSQLRDGEDEQAIADIAASILFKEPLAYSGELMDRLYDVTCTEYVELDNALTTYGQENLIHHIKTTFSVLCETISSYSQEVNALRKVVSPNSGNPIKAPFFAIYMAFFHLVVMEEMTPDNPREILAALMGLNEKITVGAKKTLTRDRVQNINLTEGLIRKFFVKKEPPALRHGPGLAIDLQNSLRRSKIETTRYEMKQGILRLSDNREEDPGMIDIIVTTACAIANIGPGSDGYIFIGVADKKSDAERIQKLDQVDFVEVSERYVVGIDREATLLGIKLENYVAKIANGFRNSKLSEPLKTQLLAKIDVVTFHSLSVIRITVPAQKSVSFVDEIPYIRQQSSTVEAKGRALLAVNDLFG